MGIGAIVGSIGGALGSAAGSTALTAAASIGGAALTAKESKDAAKDNRDFQQYNSDTAYQRAVADMRKANLNPILAAKLGGASTPAGAMAQVPDYGTAFTQAYTATTNRIGTESTLGVNDAQITKINQEVKNLGAQLGLTKVQTEAAVEGITKIVAEVEKIKAETGFRQAMTAIPGLVADFLNEFAPGAGSARTLFDQIGGSIGGAVHEAQKKVEKLIIRITKDYDDFKAERQQIHKDYYGY